MAALSATSLPTWRRRLLSAMATSPPSPSSAPTAKLGLATKLMKAAQNAMEQASVEYVSLHVRKSNRAAFNLYAETLGYKIHDMEAKYYVDGENAYDMRKQLKGKQTHQHHHSGGHHHHHHHHHRHEHGGGCCSSEAKAETRNAKRP
ncbi:hypothetical protein HN51_008847 [Arachis hypogaea]|uniref:N-acetyltransferase domain-containing protein n=1 Tax=Arachis hypogaea TaxID=3818 RepID=A0A445D1S2_ARAHY|nr:hypothetical protein Ahy_A05g022864 [Arachis hypogaea]